MAKETKKCSNCGGLVSTKRRKHYVCLKCRVTSPAIINVSKGTIADIPKFA